MLAAELGATYVSTTLSGYTGYTGPKPETSDLELIRNLAAHISVPIIAEGRYNTPGLARAAIDAGAYAVPGLPHQGGGTARCGRRDLSPEGRGEEA